MKKETPEFGNREQIEAIRHSYNRKIDMMIQTQPIASFDLEGNIEFTCISPTCDQLITAHRYHMANRELKCPYCESKYYTGNHSQPMLNVYPAYKAMGTAGNLF